MEEYSFVLVEGDLEIFYVFLVYCLIKVMNDHLLYSRIITTRYGMGDILGNLIEVICHQLVVSLWKGQNKYHFEESVLALLAM
jgi:hypothetical protein